MANSDVLRPRPSIFRSLQEAQELTDSLGHALYDQGLGTSNIRAEQMAIFS